MKRTIVFAAIVFASFAPTTVFANKLDLSTVTCKQFLESSKENIGIILTWLEGYYSGDDDDPVIDFDKMGQNGKKLGASCGSDPELGLITAAEKIYNKDK